MDNFDKRNVKKIDAMPHIGQKPKASPSRVEVLQSSTHRVASELDKKVALQTQSSMRASSEDQAQKQNIVSVKSEEESGASTVNRPLNASDAKHDNESVKRHKSKKASSFNGLIKGAWFKYAIVAIIALASVALVVLLIGALPRSLGDDFFVTTDSKYVLSADLPESDSDPYVPIRIYTVYNHKDGEIIDAKYYYLYSNEEKARASFDKFLSDANGNSENNMAISGKYVYFDVDKADYAGLIIQDIINYNASAEFDSDGSEYVDDAVTNDVSEQTIDEPSFGENPNGDESD